MPADKVKLDEETEAAFAEIERYYHKPSVVDALALIRRKLEEAEVRLEAHRRFHGKAGCPGEDCYVCEVDE